MPTEANIRLCDIGEDELIAHLIADLRMDDSVLCGPGDDCAVLTGSSPEWLDLLKTDVVVEHVHFASDADPEQVGWKALARPLSDIAAMGGLPTAAVVTIVTPDHLPLSQAVGWYRGMQKVAQTYGFSVVGGESSSSPANHAVISVSMTGRVEPDRCIYRSGAKQGDAILVTGRLGGSLPSGRHLNFQPRLTESRWLGEFFKINAMMDLSDGLAKDLPRMMKLSELGYHVDVDRLPCHHGADAQAAMGDGEDYELLFTITQAQVPDLLSAWKQQFANQLDLTVIGEVVAAAQSGDQLSGGWDHFDNEGSSSTSK
ncbi:MAG: thiamine-phosphate kinase [Verrucomicrobiota bacterium]